MIVWLFIWFLFEIGEGVVKILSVFKSLLLIVSGKIVWPLKLLENSGLLSNGKIVFLIGGNVVCSKLPTGSFVLTNDVDLGGIFVVKTVNGLLVDVDGEAEKNVFCVEKVGLLENVVT